VLGGLPGLSFGSGAIISLTISLLMPSPAF
jgi:hypothetical protein